MVEMRVLTSSQVERANIMRETLVLLAKVIAMEVTIKENEVLETRLGRNSKVSVYMW
jgi:hypothetical protein